MARKIPRPFSYPWGKGQIVEEASAENQYSEPTIQLLEYTDEGHEGYVTIRFCSYAPSGAFRRHPMLIGSEDIEQMRQALKQAPRLRKFLKQLVKD